MSHSNNYSYVVEVLSGSFFIQGPCSTIELTKSLPGQIIPVYIFGQNGPSQTSLLRAEMKFAHE